MLKKLFFCWLVVVVFVMSACAPADTPADIQPTDEPVDDGGDEPTPLPPVGLAEDFEGNLDAWETGADVPDDPENQGSPIPWSIELSTEQAAAGQASARFFIDGKQDDGIIWLTHPLIAEPDIPVRVHLTFDLWSASESMNTITRVAVYAGPQQPVAEGDFDQSQPAHLVEGWKTYEYSLETRSSMDGQVWVAIGISVVWETTVAHYVDNVQVEILPGDSSAAPIDDPVLLLPESAVPIYRVSADLDVDGISEEIILTGWGGAPDSLDYDFLQVFVIATYLPGEYLVAWQSEQLPSNRAEPLLVEDLNDDGYPEVISIQSMGASGQTAYLLGWREDRGYDWLRPVGGYFDGLDHFGENAVRIEDTDGDSLCEILAGYGSAGRYTDVYYWDGEAYTYGETLEDS